MYDSKTIPTEDNHNSSLAHYYGRYGSGLASPPSCGSGSNAFEINTLASASGCNVSENKTLGTASGNNISEITTLGSASGNNSSEANTLERPSGYNVSEITTLGRASGNNFSEINTVENADDNNGPAINTLDDSAGNDVSEIKTQENTDDHNVQTMEVIPDNCGRTSTCAVEFPADDQISGRVPANVWNSGSTMDVGNADARRLDGPRLPDAAPPRARYASHPNIQPAVRSSAPRPDTDNQPPDTTDKTENNTTAVRSLAPRPWHATVRLNKTTSWRPRPLCYIGLMTHIILLLLHNGDGGVEPCSPPADTTNQTTYQNITTHSGMANGGAERRSLPTMPTITTVRSPAPRPCHYPNHTVTAAQFSAQELHRPGIHPVLHVTPLPSHTPHCSRTRNCRNTAFSHRSTPPSQPHPAWRCRSVIVSGAGPPVCLPATGSIKGIKRALHHLTPHLPPPQHQRLFYQGQPLGDHDPTPTTTTTGPIHLTLRLVGLKGGGRRSRRDTDSDSTSDSDSDSHSRRKKSRKRGSKGELTQALRAMTSLADSVAGICRSIQQPQQTVTPEAPTPQRSADRHSDQARTQAEPSQGEAEPQARRRYCVSIDTRQGERQVSLQEPGQQPQHPPLCPPTPVAEPLRFYRNPHSPEVPCGPCPPTRTQGRKPTATPTAGGHTHGTHGGTAGVPQ